MDFTSEEIDRIRALRVATKQNERWRFGFNHEIRRRGTRYELHEVDVVARVHVGFDEAAVLNKVDADIAYLDEVVNMAPAMLDEIEQLQKIRQQLDDAEKSEAVLLNRAEVAEKRLRIASHIKDSDASSFDWSVLDEIERLREEVEDLQRYKNYVITYDTTFTCKECGELGRDGYICPSCSHDPSYDKEE